MGPLPTYSVNNEPESTLIINPPPTISSTNSKLRSITVPCSQAKTGIIKLMIDSGATHSVVKADSLKLEAYNSPSEHLFIQGVNGPSLTVTGSVVIPITSEASCEFLITPDPVSFTTDGILGYNFFKPNNVRICYDIERILLKNGRETVSIEKLSTTITTMVEGRVEKIVVLNTDSPNGEYYCPRQQFEDGLIIPSCFLLVSDQKAIISIINPKEQPVEISNTNIIKQVELQLESIQNVEVVQSINTSQDRLSKLDEELNLDHSKSGVELVRDTRYP